jgi:hypothetical protein
VKNHLISDKTIAEFALEEGVTRQAIQNRIKRGWRFGILDGNLVMFNPINICEVSEANKALVYSWIDAKNKPD